VKVSDFGIAKARDASAATASTLIKGKPAYMSPEQANGQALDGRSDLFAVGVMMWELLIGKRLFVAEDTRGTLAAVMFGKIPRPRSIRPEVPKDLERIVMKLLERDLPARYVSAEPAIAELLKCVDAKGGRDAMMALLAERFAKDAPVRKGSTPRAVAAEAATVASSPRAQRRKSPLRWVVVGVIAALVAVGGYAVMAKMHGSAAVTPDAATGPRGHANGEGWFRVGDVADAGSD
jgi:Protein kinase domain